MITVTVQRDSAGSKIGLAAKTVNSKIVITRVLDGSLFASTDLRAGQVIVSVNDIPFAGMTAGQALALMTATVGVLTIVADDGAVTVATVQKDSADSKIGLAVKTVNGEVVVTRIVEGRLFAPTDLRVGQIIVSVNDVPCAGITGQQAMSLMTDAVGVLTVVARARDGPAVVVSPPANGANYPPNTEPGGVWYVDSISLASLDMLFRGGGEILDYLTASRVR